MSRRDLSIPTPDGNARAFLFSPSEGVGPWPAVLFFMDGLAIRPTLFDMAQRLADAGYSVLLPDMFWRLGTYEPLVPAEVIADPEVMKQTFERLFASTDPVKSMIDTAAFLGGLDSEPSADTSRVGGTGYCMGGGMALRAAATFPDRIACYRRTGQHSPAGIPDPREGAGSRCGSGSLFR